MANTGIKRRHFLGALMACGAAIPLSPYPRALATTPALDLGKKIRWGYPEGAIRLNSNENPLGPSPEALKAMEKAFAHAHRYTSSNQLIEDLAAFHQVSEKMILAGCGSTEFLRIAPWTFLRGGGELVTALQTYQTMIRECMRIGVKLNAIPLSKDFAFDLPAMRTVITPKTKMVYLVNPNNPTGTSIDFDEIQKFCASLPKHIIVFIDEAYSQFLKDERGRSGITLIKQGYNVIVSRTFSKVHGLAGMRLGYVIAPVSIIEELKIFGFKNMGINQAAFAGGVASIEDERHIRKYLDLVEEGKEYFYEQFEDMGLQYIRSTTPFLMVKVKISSKTAQKKLASKNVFIRKGEDWHMPGYLRISMGFSKENKACVEAMKKTL